MKILESQQVTDRLDESVRSLVTTLEVFESIDSTNSYLARVEPPSPGKLRVAIADEQTAGRGRQEREWVSPRGQGLYQSLAYCVDAGRKDLPSLTLALGVGVLDALQELGIEGVQLKWPNDLVADNGKLGGLLAETRSVGAGLVVTAGIGINLFMSERTRQIAASGWAQRGVALNDIADDVPDMCSLAVAITHAVAGVFTQFESTGLAGYVERWRAADWLLGRRVSVSSPGASHSGIASGIDNSGALMIETGSGKIPITAGTVSVS